MNQFDKPDTRSFKIGYCQECDTDNVNVKMNPWYGFELCKTCYRIARKNMDLEMGIIRRYYGD